MSKIGKNTIKIPENTTFKFENSNLSVKGKLGEVTISISNLFTLEEKDNEIYVLPKNEKDKKNPLWGTTRAHVANTFLGVCNGFAKTLELNGTGYRASLSGTKL